MSGQTRSLRQRLISGGAWVVFGKILTAIAGVLVAALLTRLLTPDEMGVYFLVISVGSGFVVLAKLGLGSAVVRLVAETMSRHEEGATRLVVIRVFAYGTLSTLLVCLFIYATGGEMLGKYVFDSPKIMQVAGLMSVWVMVMTFQGLLAETFRGFHNIKNATLYDGVVTTLVALFILYIILLIRGESALKEVLIISIIAGATSVSISGYLLAAHVARLGTKGIGAQYRLLPIAIPLLVTNLSAFALAQIDLWIVGAMLPAEDVAVYGAAKRLVLLVAMPLFIVNSVVPPIIAELYSKSELSRLGYVVRSTATIAGFPALLALLVFIWQGDFILGLVYGDYYREGFLILVILSLSKLFSVWAGSCGFVLQMTGHQVALMVITLFGAFLTLAGAYLTVDTYGTVGVAGSVAFAIVVQNTLMILLVRRKVGIWTHMEPNVWRAYTRLARKK